ncbi:acyl-CoA thioesterase [Pedobacter sp. MC2016-14]|uniref:acyl-CoA thioesterase n=1 Tax=Pedobacter sp. MC2016-14 TaxID=2897327 RepID=UPI001E4AF0E7|nr:acyl-CoA thioesterase [Pedobacter sp. MC2016-14]MCD0490276.1 acyl-CoA thioesterase [Pedobacter sp. MC2016-14]
MQDYKTVESSQTTLTELMIPSYSNFGGKIHGGIILSLMDKVAYVCAAKHSDGYCITASIDVVDFLAPVEVGELVSLMASVNYVGKTSMIIGIKVISENVRTHVVKHTNTSYFTMVAIGEDHKPKQVPGLILKSQDDIRRFSQAKNRRELKATYKRDEASIKDEFNTAECLISLRDERCQIFQ